MRYLRLSFASLMLFVFAESCASVGKLNTPSTKPEITLKSVDKKKVLDALVSWSAMKGRMVESATEYNLATSGEMDVFVGGFVDVRRLARTTYTLVQKSNDVTLYCQRVITHPAGYSFIPSVGAPGGSAEPEHTAEYNSQRAYNEMQAELEEFAKFLSKQETSF